MAYVRLIQISQLHLKEFGVVCVSDCHRSNSVYASKAIISQKHTQNSPTVLCSDSKRNTQSGALAAVTWAALVWSE